MKTTASLFLFLAAGCALAQNGILVFRGEVAGRLAGKESLWVELFDRARNTPVEKANVMPDGGFEFRHIQAGEYEVRLVDFHGTEMQREYVTVHSGVNQPLTLRLAESKLQRPVSGVVSAARLGHSVPGKARKEFGKGDRAKSPAEAIRHYQAAVRIDPEYMEAWNNLGSHLLKSGQIEDGAGALERAIALDACSSIALTNLAVARMAQGRTAEAEHFGRRAVGCDASSPKTHYVLGLALARQNKNLSEAAFHLRRAAAEFPQVNLVVQALERRGR